MKETTAAATTTPTRALAFGDWKNGKLRYDRRVIAVSGFADASMKWSVIRDAKGFGSSDSPIVVVIDTTTGEQLAKVSYNGRVWGIDGKEIKL